MRKIFILGAMMIASIAGHAQLANPGFETIDSIGNPNHWGRQGFVVLPTDTNCVWLGIDSVNFITTDAHSGSYAYEMGVAAYCDFRYGGYIQARRFDQDSFVDQRTLFTGRPAAFTFYYKLEPVQDDQGMAQVVLENQAGLVADGVLKLSQATTGWALATVALTYYNTDTPEFLSMEFALHNDTALHYGSRFLIDDINNTQAAAVNELRQPVAQQLSCYPVPASGELTISLSGLRRATEGQLSISDATGRQLRTQRVTFTESGKIELDVRQLPAGMYFIRLSAMDVVATGKFIK